MDDDNEPRRRDDVLAALTRQPLDPLSVDELNDRIAVLQQEIERTRARIDFATSHKASADALFKKGIVRDIFATSPAQVATIR